MKSKIVPIFLAALLSLCATLFATNTWAEDIWTRDKLTGDRWEGARGSPITADGFTTGVLRGHEPQVGHQLLRQ